VDLEEKVLAQIVRMCRTRIVERTKTSSGIPFSNRISQVIDLVQQVKDVNGTKTFRKRARQLHSRLETVDDEAIKLHKSTLILDNAIQDLIGSCKVMADAPMTAVVLRDEALLAVDRANFSRQTAAGILNKIRKIGRYGTCAERLVRLSRRITNFQRIETMCITLDAASRRHVPRPLDTTQKMVADRLGMTSDQETRLRKRTGSWSFDSRTTFKRSLSSAKNSSAKIHAEVQLYWYMEQHAIEPRPRVIESCKNACFLCGAFLAWTGKYVKPRSHGRLYPGWRLPSTALEGTHNIFATKLEMLLPGCFTRQLGPHKVPKCEPADCESSVTLDRATVDSVLTVLEEVDEDQDAVGHESDGSETTIRAAGSSTPQASPRLNGEHEPAQQTTTLNGAMNVVASHTPECPPEQTEMPPESAEWRSASPGATVCARSCDKLQVFVERGGSAGEEGQQRKVRVRVRQISDKEVVNRGLNGRVHDIEADLRPGQDVDCGTRCKSVLMRVDGQLYVTEIEEREGTSNG
jgi:hypothetical protein